MEIRVSVSENSSVRLEVLVADTMKYMSFASRMDGSMNKNGISSLHILRVLEGGKIILPCVCV